MTPADNDATMLNGLEAEQPKKRRSKLLGMFMVIVMLISAVAVIAIWREVKGDEDMPRTSYQNTVQSSVVDTTNRTIPEVEQKFKALSDRVDLLTERLAKLEQASPAATTEAEKPAGIAIADTADVVRLKDEVATLTMALGDVQTQLKQAAADKGHYADQSSLATVVAFTQLRSAAESGEGFKPEYDALYEAASRDVALQEIIARLGPIAVEGAPSFGLLREEFLGLMPVAQAAANRAQAQTWKDRIWVELQSLVSIKPLYPTAGGASVLEGVQGDLAQHKIGEAAEKIRLLPDAAQDILKEWHMKLEARQKLEDTLKDIAAKLIALKPVIEPVAAPVALPIPGTEP